MVISPEEARAYMLYQLGALDAFAKANGVKTSTYWSCMELSTIWQLLEKNLADAVLDGIEEFNKDIIVMTLSGSYMAKEAKRRGLKVAEEVFADRGYNADGTLVNRTLPGAFVKDPDEAIARVIKMVKLKKLQL